LPQQHDLTPGDLHLSIQQYDQPRADQLSARTFSEPAHIASVELHAGDRSLLLSGTRLNEIDKLTLGDLVFTPEPSDDSEADSTSLRLSLPASPATPAIHIDDRLTAKIALHDGRVLTLPITVSAPRPVITLLGKSQDPAPGNDIALANPDDLPLTSRLTFTLKSPAAFPRNSQIEIETLDGTLRTVLTLAPSGGLLLQDPHTLVATLDPLRSFGPSAFGALHLRAVYPRPHTSDSSSHPAEEPASPPEPPSDEAEKPTSPTEPRASDWLPLATLVRLPTLSQLQCPADATQPCIITGSDLFLLQSVSSDPAFADPVTVPDGDTATTLTVPHLSAATLFLKLRDDPAQIDSAILPQQPVIHQHMGSHTSATKP
jgi:hypothetical protein